MPGHEFREVGGIVRFSCPRTGLRRWQQPWKSEWELDVISRKQFGAAVSRPIFDDRGRKHRSFRYHR